MTGPDAGFVRIVELLASHYGFDSRDYKQGTLHRRAARRMELMGFSEWPSYATYLERQPDELTALYRDVLVGVTRFFCNPAQWEHLEREIVPSILRARPDPYEPIRIWSAGCATGEEAYGLAMIFLEQLERRASPGVLQVFATDVSQDAVAFARKGVYPRSIAADVPPHRLERFFTPRGETYQLARQVRERVTVGCHDLLADPPFSSLDLVACRNVFVHLEPHAQQECLRSFHFSLLPHGVLWLGDAEAIDRQDERFRAIGPEHRMYQRAEGPRRGALPWSTGYERLLSSNEELQAINDALVSSKAEALSLNEELQTVNRELEERNARLHAMNAELESLLAVTTIPTLFLDRRLCVRRFVAAARGVMELTPEDVGRPLEHIEPRVAGERLLEDAKQVLDHLVAVEAELRGEDGRWLLRRAVPLRSDGRVGGVCITFIDVPPRPSARGPAGAAS